MIAVCSYSVFTCASNWNVGLNDNGIHGKLTQALVLERSSVSSIPFVIDDPPKSSSKYNTIDVNDVIVDCYNGLMSGNVKSGVAKPLSSAMISTNFDIKADARYVPILFLMSLTLNLQKAYAI